MRPGPLRTSRRFAARGEDQVKVVELKEKYHSMQPGKTLDFNAFVGFCWVVQSGKSD